MMKTKFLAVTLLAAGALALAACGGGSDTSSSSSSTTSSTSTSGGDVTAFCNEVKGLQAIGDKFGNLSSTDLAGTKSALQQVADQLQKIDDVAPAEVKSDMDALVAAFGRINDAFQGANSPADVQKLGSGLQSDVKAMQQSLAKAKSFGKANCNL
jgi:hypothetical protein